MKTFSGVLVVVALAASACGSGQSSSAPTIAAKKVSATAPVPALAKLPPAVRKEVERYLRAAKHPTKDSTVNRIAVYGPGREAKLEFAWDNSTSLLTPRERKAHWYITVLYGRFICNACKGVFTSPPRGTVEIFLWSPTPRTQGGFGLMRKFRAPCRGYTG